MNTVWIGLTTGIVTGLVAGGILLFAEYRTGWFSKRHKKELTVSIISESVLISPNDKEISDKLEVKYYRLKDR